MPAAKNTQAALDALPLLLNSLQLRVLRTVAAGKHSRSGATLRQLERSGHIRRHIEGWLVMPKGHAALSIDATKPQAAPLSPLSQTQLKLLAGLPGSATPKTVAAVRALERMGYVEWCYKSWRPTAKGEALLTGAATATALQRMTILPSGWLDGEGVPVPKDIAWVQLLLELASVCGLPQLSLYPTLEGRIRGEQSIGVWELAVEFDVTERNVCISLANVATHAHHTYNWKLLEHHYAEVSMLCTQIAALVAMLQRTTNACESAITWATAETEGPRHLVKEARELLAKYAQPATDFEVDTAPDCRDGVHQAHCRHYKKPEDK